MEAFINQLPSAALVFDPGLALSTWNGKAEQAIEGGLSDLKGLRVSQTVHLPEGWDWEALYCQFQLGEQVSLVCQLPLTTSASLFKTSFTPLFHDTDFQGLLVQFEPDKPRSPLDALEEALVIPTSVLDNLEDSVLITEPLLEYPGPRIQYVNKAFTQMTGYRPDEVIGKTPRMLQGPETNSQELSKLRTSLTNKESFKSETINYRKNGEAFLLQWEVNPIKGPDGQVRYYMAVQRDVTAYRQLEWRKQVALKNHMTLLEQSAVPMAILQQGKFCFVNQALANLLNYESPDKLLGTASATLLHEDFQGLAQERQQYLEQQGGEVEPVEVSLLNSQGKAVTASVTGFSCYYGDAPAIQIVIKDLSQQKATEKALRWSEAYYRQLFQNAPIGIVTLDLHYCLLSCNEGFTNLFGYTEDELKGQVLDKVIVPEQHREEGQALCEGPLKGKATYRETARLDKQGHEIPVIVYGIPIFFDGEPVSIYGMYIDISERKQAENDLRKQTEALLYSNAELEQFAYVTSHHMRSPVVNLQSLIGLFDTRELQNPENQYIFQKISDSAQELNHTLTDLTHIVGKKEQISEPKELISFQAILDESKAWLSQTIDETSAQITADFSRAPRIRYLRSFLSSICYHLLSNALHFRHSNRVPEVHFQTVIFTNYTCLTVADNGLGIPLSRNEDKLFELYKGFHPGLSGKGMGLYLVKYQVEALNGYIQVSTTEEEGTTFHIYLKNSI